MTRPRPGDRVRIHYAATLRVRPGLRVPHPCRLLWEGVDGTVVVAARGPGPRNVLVRLDDGQRGDERKCDDC